MRNYNTEVRTVEHFLWIQFLYCVRWQLSTPILAIVPIAYKKLLKREKLSKVDIWLSVIIGNFIGALIFIWIDMFIFHK